MRPVLPIPAAPIRPITRLRRDQIDEAAQVLTRAFMNDPDMIYLVPDPVRRAAIAPQMFRVTLLHALRFGEVYTTPGQVEGIAMWFYPGDIPMTFTRSLWSGSLLTGVRVLRGLGSEGIQRSQAIADFESRWQVRYLPQPHWYLAFLGVDPASQGKGIGSALMQPILERADAAHVPCYLETATEDNVRFYEKRGFAVVAQDVIDGAHAGPPIWAMIRQADL